MKDIYLTQKEFDDLLEYSTSQPTGVILGKVWKSKSYIFKSPKGKIYNAGWLPPDVELMEVRWYHCQYVKSAKEGYMDTKMRDLEVVGELEIDKTIQKFKDRHASR